VFTFSLDEAINLTPVETTALYTKDPGPVSLTGDIIVPDKAGNPNLALTSVSAENTVYLYEYSGSSWVEKFKRTSELSGFGYRY